VPSTPVIIRFRPRLGGPEGCWPRAKPDSVVAFIGDSPLRSHACKAGPSSKL
jgi:hypothetical protein